jgi:hypothetical protein
MNPGDLVHLAASHPGGFSPVYPIPDYTTAKIGVIRPNQLAIVLEFVDRSPTAQTNMIRIMCNGLIGYTRAWLFKTV